LIFNFLFDKYKSKVEPRKISKILTMKNLPGNAAGIWGNCTNENGGGVGVSEQSEFSTLKIFLNILKQFEI